MSGRGRCYERAQASCEKVLGSEHPNTNRARYNLARLLLVSGSATEALAFGETALAAHDKVLGPDHHLSKDSARVTADALGSADKAAALRARYGVEHDARGKE